MLKLLFLPTRYFPAISGAEFYLQRMAEILSAKYNYTIDIITSNAIDFRALRDSKGKILSERNKYYNYVNKIKIDRYPINYSLSFEEKVLKLSNINEFKALQLDDALIKYFLEKGPFLDELLSNLSNFKYKDYRLIHTTFYPYFNLIIALMLGKKLDIPTICTPFFHFSNPRYLNSRAVKLLEKFDVIIACTELEKNFLIKNYKIPEIKIQVIPMGVDFEIFLAKILLKSSKFSFKHAYFAKNEHKYKMVLFCGYKNYEKGALSILKAIPLIIKKVPKVYFVFIGPTTLAFNRELSKLNRFWAPRIINLTPENLTGYFDEKKISAFQETDIFLMPSRSDAFGIAFLEAWASGKPVIGANIGATKEVIRNQIDGLLVEFDNPVDISNSVIKLLKNKRLRKKFGNKGQKKTELYFKWDIIAKKTNVLYKKHIAKENHEKYCRK